MFKVSSPRFVKGFTAIELMVTIAILGMLAAIAAPSFKPVIERWKVRQVTEELQSTFYVARSEAIKRGGGITILRNGDTTDCTAVGSDTSLWSCGWTVFADANSNGVQDSGEDTLQTISLPANVSIKLSDTSEPAFIKVDRWGQLSAAHAAIQLKGSSDAQASTSALCISGNGRIHPPDTGSTSCT